MRQSPCKMNPNTGLPKHQSNAIFKFRFNHDNFFVIYFEYIFLNINIPFLFFRGYHRSFLKYLLYLLLTIKNELQFNYSMVTRDFLNKYYKLSSFIDTLVVELCTFI